MKLSIKYTLACVMMLLSFAAYADDNVSLIVTNDGESIKVYNLDYSGADYCYYTATSDSDELKRIKKSDILIIKLADGTKIDPTACSEFSSFEKKIGETNLSHQEYSPTTYYAIEDEFVMLKIKPAQGMNGYIGMKKRYFSYHPDMLKDEHLAKFILAANEEGSVLHFRLISEKENTLAVARPRTEKQVKQFDGIKIKEIEYDKSEYHIPDYVMIGDTKYTVVEIDPCAFLNKKNINNVIFPETLQIIGPRAFEECRLNRIILPQSIEIVGDMAFFRNLSNDFQELFIPKGIKQIGNDCFRFVGTQLSPRGFTETYLSSAPDFITTENCTEFGIDDNSVESYERRNHK